MTDEELRKLIRRTNELVGNISIPQMLGDNLAIVLCQIFTDPDEPEEEYGWGASAINGYEATIKAIREHYAPICDELLEARTTIREMSDRIQELVEEVERLGG